MIRIPAVRVVDENGEMLGVMPTERAIAKAREAGLDLIEVSPNANPPVCKIADYGKLLYSLKKQEGKAKKAGKQKEMKGIRLSPRIGENDLVIKAKRANEFLEKKHPIKVELRFRGREITHKEVAEKVMNSFIDKVIWGKPDAKPKLQGRQMLVIMSPLNKPKTNETKDSLGSEEES